MAAQVASAVAPAAAPVPAVAQPAVVEQHPSSLWAERQQVEPAELRNSLVTERFQLQAQHEQLLQQGRQGLAIVPPLSPPHKSIDSRWPSQPKVEAIRYRPRLSSLQTKGLLGIGGFGRVELARDRETRRLYALKVSSASWR